jgi:hypothetical protein
VRVAAEAQGSESEHFPAMLDALNETMHGLRGEKEPLSAAIGEGDTGYFSERTLQAAKERGVETLIADPHCGKGDAQCAGRKHHGGTGRFTADDFVYHKKKNSYTCPGKKELIYKGQVELNRNSGETYQERSADCAACKLRGRCIAGRGGESPKRTVYITDKWQGENLSEELRQKIDQGKYRALYGRRMQIIELCFADLRHCKGMDRFTRRGKLEVKIQWLLYCIVHKRRA